MREKLENHCALSGDKVEMANREFPIMGATLIRLYKMIYFSIEKQAHGENYELRRQQQSISRFRNC